MIYYRDNTRRAQRLMGKDSHCSIIPHSKTPKHITTEYPLSKILSVQGNNLRSSYIFLFRFMLNDMDKCSRDNASGKTGDDTIAYV